MATTDNTLLIIERAHRGAVETQFADTLFFVRELHRQSGGVHVALRGLAASYAVDTTYEAALRIAGRTLDTLPDPRRLLRQLLDDGATVFVEEADLSALGARARERLLPGVRRVTGAELVSRWSDYARVWFF
ncbi:hypothetical protein [Streptomyces sp. 5-10]|uniref:hypothetical protein n=1 Tax=Streptomyces sp. 5-10 TaxID=878925 RepID=UPI00168AEB6E|nr:hypothetical protein [Streptomyces sp. 5-10]MBD3009701.1 hypothetical protein [Streptomyces sp. 5-10]